MSFASLLGGLPLFVKPSPDSAEEDAQHFCDQRPERGVSWEYERLEKMVHFSGEQVRYMEECLGLTVERELSHEYIGCVRSPYWAWEVCCKDGSVSVKVTKRSLAKALDILVADAIRSNIWKFEEWRQR